MTFFSSWLFSLCSHHINLSLFSPPTLLRIFVITLNPRIIQNNLSTQDPESHLRVPSVSRSVPPNSLRPHGLQPTRLLCPWGFSRQGYWSGLPFPPPGDLPDSGIEPGFLHCRQILYNLSCQQSLTSAKSHLNIR